GGQIPRLRSTRARTRRRGTGARFARVCGSGGRCQRARRRAGAASRRRRGADEPGGADGPRDARMNKSLPLAGVRVLDFTRNVAGPFATMILAELGADVVKIEPPDGGDDARQWGPPFWGGETPTFLALNRNKRSVALDLKDAGARTVLDRLAAVSD